MRARRLSLRLLLPAGLILLVMLLGALQYRWLGQVSEAERAQLGRSLSQRASEFAAEFDREMALASTMLAIDGEALDRDPWGALHARYDAWRERAMFPDMVKALYLARSEEEGHALAKWTGTAAGGEAIAWPDHLSSLRATLGLYTPRVSTPPAPARVTGVTARANQFFTMSISPVIDTVPALIVSIATRPVRIRSDMDVMVAVRMAGTDYVVVELSRAVLADQLIPALAERYFPLGEADHYKVAVLDRSDSYIYSRGFNGTAEQKLHVDASALFFAGARSEFSAQLMTEGHLMSWQMAQQRRPNIAIASATDVGKPRDEAESRQLIESIRQVLPTPGGSVSLFVDSTNVLTPTMTTATRIAMPGWRVILQHGAGSLDEAVAQARVRNLATSFGILAVLMAGVGLIIGNARKSERLASQQMEFVATVSHELRTPLAVIRSAAQNLSAGVVDEPAQAKRYGELIETEGRRLTDMVEEVLEFAGLDGNRRPLALRPVDVEELARDVLATHAASLADGNIDASVTSHDDVGPALADEDAIRRALNNLVANAIKYAADGRWIGVTISREFRDGRDHIRIDVSDRGPGIAAGDLPHLFEPFYRGRDAMERQIHGNGLGLSLVARIAQAHGGSATVSSSPDAGATFTLRIPSADNDVVHG